MAPAATRRYRQGRPVTASPPYTACQRGAVTLACALALAAAAPAAERPHSLEAGVKHYQLDQGFAPTTGGYLTTRLNPPGADSWVAEAVWLDRFEDHGTFLGLTNTHDWGPHWYSTQGVGIGTDGFFWPRLRLDATLNRRSQSVPGLVTTVGAGYIDYPDEYSDRYLSLGLSYYLRSSWVVQASVTVNDSDPGSVRAETYTAAVTHGRDRERFVSLRASAGRQGYQAVGATAFNVDFPFRSLRLTWREWVHPDWGFNLVGELYGSDAYDHWGVEAGLFRHF